MLLQFLSILFQYVFLHCGVAANSKDEFLDYSITEFWWSSTPGIEQTDRITPQYSFLTTPIGWLDSGGTSTPETPRTPKPEVPPEAFETFFPFPNTTRPSYPFDVENYTVVKLTYAGIPEYWHTQYPGLTPPPNFPPDYRYPTIYSYPTEIYIPKPTGPTPKGPSFSFPSTFSLTDVVPTEFTIPERTTRTPTVDRPRPSHRPSTTVPPYVQKWQQEISSYAAAESWTPTNVAPELRQVFNYDYKIEGFSEVFRRIRKTPQDAGSILKSRLFEDQTRSILREEITKRDRKEAIHSESHDEASSYDPNEEWYQMQKRTKYTQTNGTKQSQTIEDDNDIRKTISRNNEKNQSSHVYFEKIKTLQEGYMIVFLLELTRLIATKERDAVRDVVKHTDQIIYGFYKRKQLLWFGQPLTNVTRKAARFLRYSTIDIIQNHAANLYHMLSERRQELSVEVNTILEYADMLYKDDEGRRLFDALNEFAAYPNISLTGYWLCNNLIHNFLRPYRRLKDTEQRHELIDSVNLQLKTHLRSGDVKGDGAPDDAYKAEISPGNVITPFKTEHSVGISPPNENPKFTKKETKLSTPIQPTNQTEPHNDSTWSPKERKRKRHHRLHKRKRGRKRHYRLHKRKRERKKKNTHTDLT